MTHSNVIVSTGNNTRVPSNEGTEIFFGHLYEKIVYHQVYHLAKSYVAGAATCFVSGCDLDFVYILFQPCYG